MSARAGLRLFSQSARQSSIRAPFRTRQFRRQNTTAASPTVEIPGPVKQSLLQRLWTSEVGIKTVHFWAPIMKWGVVLAGVADFFRPAEKLSLTQNLALMATGSIWTRWCFVIRPQNIFLASVNFCLFLVGTTQVSRIFLYRASHAGSAEAAVKEIGSDLKATVKDAEKKVEQKLA